MAFAGGLLAALQRGSAALAFPAVAVVVAVADGSLIEALAISALALVALESGVLWASLGAGAGARLSGEGGIYLSQVGPRQGRSMAGGVGERVGSVGRAPPGRGLTIRLR